MAMPDPGLGDYADTAAAVFTALAAFAALGTVRQGRELIEAAEAPHLEAQVLRDAGTGHLRLAIINTGKGIARGTNFAVHALGHLTDDVIGDGYLLGGARVHVMTDIGPLPAPTGQMRPDLDDLGVMVAYRDAAGYAHYRTHAGDEKVPRTLIRRRPKYPDRVAVFRSLFPHIDLDQAVRSNHALEPVE